MLIVIICFVLAALQGAVASKATADLIATLHRFAEYSAAVYCGNNYLAFPANLSVCPKDVCPELQSPSITRVSAFAGPKEPYGVFVMDHQSRQIIISFRGTVTDQDWHTNLDFILENASDVCQDCSAHSGFLNSWRNGRDPILNTWSSLLSQYPDYETLVTGHSLGGALATFCALEIAHEQQTYYGSSSVSLFTYGAPRIGDDGLATYIEMTLGANGFRVTHLNDPVPRLPGRLLGFRHPYPEYHITSPHIPHALNANESVLTSPSNLAVQSEDLLILNREESDRGNNGYSCSNVNMHDAYFMDISRCATGDDTPLLGKFAEGVCDAVGICCKE